MICSTFPLSVGVSQRSFSIVFSGSVLVIPCLAQVIGLFSGNTFFAISPALLAIRITVSPTFPAISQTDEVTDGSDFPATFRLFNPSGIAPSCIAVENACW